MSTTSSLVYKDLRGYLDAVDKLGELRIVNGADWDLEIGAITEVAARAANPKVVLFDNIKDYPKGFRVVTNPVCSAATTALAFGLDPKLTGLDIIRAWKEKLGSQKPIKPVEVSRGRLRRTSTAATKSICSNFPRRAGTSMTAALHRHGLHGDHGRSRWTMDQCRHLSRLRARQEYAWHLDFAGKAWPADSGKILGAGKTLSSRDQLRSGSGSWPKLRAGMKRGACRNWKSPAGCSASR